MVRQRHQTPSEPYCQGRWPPHAPCSPTSPLFFPSHLRYIERVAELHRRSSMPPIFLLPYPFPFVSIPIPSNTPIFYLVNATKSRMNLFRLNDQIDLGPAISSVCQRRSLGLLNLYRLLFRVPITPSVCPRSLRICSRTASATDQSRLPLG